MRRGLGMITVAVVVTGGWLVAPGTASAAPSCEGYPATVVGTDGPDHLVGTPVRNEVFVALGGDDLIDGDLTGDIVCGGDGDDTITSGGGLVGLGEAGDDTITIGASNDITDVGRIEGGDGNDVLTNQGRVQVYFVGGAGDDRMVNGPSAFADFLPGPGSDYVDGGPSGGVLHYYDATAPVVVNLAGGYAKDSGVDRIRNIDSFDGSRYSDLLIGDGNANDINCCFTSPGIDTIFGGGGDDLLRGQGTLVGGPGNDTFEYSLIGRTPNSDRLVGGPGIDLIDYTSNGAPVVVDLNAGTATGQAIGSDTLTGIENVRGSVSGDTITGNDQANVIEGSGGRDTLHGAGGDDELYGQGGDDLLDGGPGTDLLDGGKQTDTCLEGEILRSCEN